MMKFQMKKRLWENYENIPFEIYNIASGTPKSLKKLIVEIEKNLNRKAIFNLKGLQIGDVVKTHGDISKLKS